MGAEIAHPWESSPINSYFNIDVHIERTYVITF